MIRNKRGHFWFVGVPALLVLSLLIWRIWPTPQPYYKGKPLAYWFKQLPRIYGNKFPTNRFPIPPEAYSFNNPFNPQKKIWVIQGVVGTNVFGYSLKDPLDPETPSVVAIRNMGTNAFPFLFGKLTRRRSEARELMGQIAIKCGLKRFFFSHFPSLRAEQAQATTGLLALLPLPQESVSRLQTLSTTNDEWLGVYASWVLKINAEYQANKNF